MGFLFSPSFEVAGDCGMIVCEARRGKSVSEMKEFTFLRNEMGAKKYRETSTAYFGKPSTWECTIPCPGETRGHVDVTQNFVNSILDGTALIAPGEEGIASVELANAMLLSSWTDQRIGLPLDGAAYEMALQVRIQSSRFRKKTVAAQPVDMEASFR